jgi:acyl carrier protein
MPNETPVPLNPLDSKATKATATSVVGCSDPELLAALEKIAAHAFLRQVHLESTTTAHDIEGWDSLSHTIFLIDIEEHFGIQIPIEQTYALKNVGELVAFLRPYLEKADRLESL